MHLRRPVILLARLVDQIQGTFVLAHVVLGVVLSFVLGIDMAGARLGLMRSLNNTIINLHLALIVVVAVFFLG